MAWWTINLTWDVVKSKKQKTLALHFYYIYILIWAYLSRPKPIFHPHQPSFIKHKH